MRFVVMKADPELEESIFPTQIYKMRKMNLDIITFCCIDQEETMIAYTVFYLPKDILYAAKLEYVYVSTDYRGEGISLQLVEYAKGKLREIGMKYLYIKSDEKWGLGEFYEKLGFHQLSSIGHYMEYSILDLVNSEIIKKIWSMREEFPAGTNGSGQDERMKKAFWAELSDRNIHLTASERCGENNQFIVDHGEIYAGMFAQVIDNNVLLISDFYTKKHPMQTSFFTVLLCDVLSSVCRHNIISKVYIQMYKSDIYNGVKNVFQKEISDTVIEEYGMVLL